MQRVLLSVLVLLLLVLAAAAPPPAAPTLTRQQAAAALSVLENPKSRDALIATLHAILEAPPAHSAAAGPPAGAAKPASPKSTLPAAAAKAAAPALPIPLTPNGLGAQVLLHISGSLSAASHATVATVRAMISLPLLSIWVATLWGDPYLHRQLFDVGWRLVLVIGAGLAAEWLAIQALTSTRAALARLAERSRSEAEGERAPLPDPRDEGEARAEAGETEPSSFSHAALRHLRRAWLSAGGFLLDLVPIVVFAAVANGLLAAGLGASTIVRLVILAVVNAYVVARILFSVMRMLMGAECEGLRLFPVSDAAAPYAMLWAHRIIGVSVFGYTATEIAVLFGLYESVQRALFKLVMLVVHLLLVIIVLQKRRPVAAWIAAPPGAFGPVASLRNLTAALWHWVAIFYLMALWVVWAIGIPHAFSLVLRFCVVTALVIAFAWACNRLVWRGIERHIRIGDDLAERFPGLERRARHYLHGLRSLLSSVVGVLALIALLEVWGIDAVDWFASNSLGGRVLGALLVIGATVIAALLIWELANSAIERHLARLSREGHVARSARLRTLLPMLRTSLVIAIAIVVGLMVLSEVGVNIAPLLAGAGVIGIAIGFGSQKLVQDIINGLFLLFENAMQVGDVVSLGGLSGVVENLSIRTIRLRDKDGSVHLIPFSAVSTVTNMTRDFSYAVFNVGVAYKEDVDHVIAVLKDITREMRKDPEWAPMIRDDLEVWGLDQFAASSVVIVCRLLTGPSQRWSVAREFNRRMKQRFDELGIEIPFPHQKLVLDQPLSLYYLPEGRNVRETSPPGAVP